jgi:hypothetical protein
LKPAPLGNRQTRSNVAVAIPATTIRVAIFARRAPHVTRRPSRTVTATSFRTTAVAVTPNGQGDHGSSWPAAAHLERHDGRHRAGCRINRLDIEYQICGFATRPWCGRSLEAEQIARRKREAAVVRRPSHELRQFTLCREDEPVLPDRQAHLANQAQTWRAILVTPCRRRILAARDCVHSGSLLRIVQASPRVRRCTGSLTVHSRLLFVRLRAVRVTSAGWRCTRWAAWRYGRTGW